MSAIIGRKIGMTQLYSDDGKVIPVTVLEAGPCPIVGIRTMEKHRYEAVQIAYGEIRAKRVSRPRRGQFKAAAIEPKRQIREVPMFEGAAVGQSVKVESFTVGSKVDVIGTSKGKGFAGVVRRHHFSGGDNAHGCKTKKQPGSVGASAFPSRVIKGKRLPGQMGNARVTMKNLVVVGVDAKENLIWVKGAVPGATNGWVLIRSVKGSPQAAKAGKGAK